MPEWIDEKPEYRPFRICIYVSARQRDRLNELAESAGLDRAIFILERALDETHHTAQPFSKLDRVALAAALGALDKLGDPLKGIHAATEVGDQPLADAIGKIIAELQAAKDAVMIALGRQ